RRSSRSRPSPRAPRCRRGRTWSRADSRARVPRCPRDVRGFVRASACVGRWPSGAGVVNLIETPTKRVLAVRDDKPRAVIVHGTGETDLDKLLAYYTAADGLGPHYLIEPHGTVRRFVDEDRIAYHAKIDTAEAHLYQLGYAEW